MSPDAGAARNILLRAPHIGTIPLPPVGSSEQILDKNTRGEEVVDVSTVFADTVHNLLYDLEENPSATEHQSGTLTTPVPQDAFFRLAGTPDAWMVYTRERQTLGDVLSLLRAMMHWPMSRAELAYLSLRENNPGHVLCTMWQCARRCEDSGEAYNGAESLKRIDWLFGATRLKRIEKVGHVFVVYVVADS